MFKDHLVSGFRNSLRDKLSTFLNIFGLGIGLAFALLAFLYVRFETSFENFYPGVEDVYRIEVQGQGFGDIPSARSGYRLKDVLDLEYPEVKSSTRVFIETATFRIQDQLFEETMLLSSPAFFDVFPTSFISGDAENPLPGPFSIILTRRMARKYFGDEDPIGQTITVNDGFIQDYQVTGVVEDIPANTHIAYDFVAPFPDAQYMMENYGVSGQLLDQIYFPFNSTYARVHPGADIAAIEEKLAKHYADNTPQDWIDLYGVSLPAFYPAKDIYLYNYSRDDFAIKGNPDLLSGLLLVAGLVLFISGVNFVNLATASFTLRAREIGVRKTMGASRRQVIIQFLSETSLSVSLALLLALLMAWIFLPVFNSLSGKELGFDIFSADILLFFATIWIVGTVLAGLYPAYVASAFKPASVLGASSSGGTGKSKMRSFLVILQLAIVAGLITSTALIYAQTRYMQNLDMGFVRDNILVINDGFTGEPEIFEQFRGRLLARRDVTGMSRASLSPGTSLSAPNLAALNPGDGQPPVTLSSAAVDADYFEILGIEPLAGRTYSHDFPADVMVYSLENPDPGGIIVNESGMKKLGFKFPEEAVGQAYLRGSRKVPATIVGVIPDHINALARNAVEPEAYYWIQAFGATLVRYQTSDLPALLEEIENTYRDLRPDRVWQYEFLDDQIRLQYEKEEIQAKILLSFAIIAILIAAFGLYAMAAFATARRTKEMGIRKVFGASVKSIIGLMAWEFTKPVIIANVIAWPVTWYLLYQWLQGYAFRIELNVLYFLAATALTFLVVLLTVAGHAYRNSQIRPVQTLRYE